MSRETPVKRSTHALTSTFACGKHPTRPISEAGPMATNWHHDAACAGMPVDIWFEQIPSYESRARFVCSICPTVFPCLRDALANGDRGIRGGLSYAERKKSHRMPVVHQVRDVVLVMKGTA